MSEQPAYGPMQAHVIALIDRASRLSHNERRALANEGGGTQYATWVLSWGAAWDAAQATDRLIAQDAARDAAVFPTWTAASHDTGCLLTLATARRGQATVQNAVSALVVRDLIGVHWTQDTYDELTRPWRRLIEVSWTQADYDELTGPWRRVIGPCHPDDAPLEMP